MNALFIEFLVANLRLRIDRKKKLKGKKGEGRMVEERKEESFISSSDVKIELESYQTWLEFLERNKAQREEGIQSHNVEQLIGEETRF